MNSSNSPCAFAAAPRSSRRLHLSLARSRLFLYRRAPHDRASLDDRPIPRWTVRISLSLPPFALGTSSVRRRRLFSRGCRNRVALPRSSCPTSASWHCAFCARRPGDLAESRAIGGKCQPDAAQQHDGQRHRWCQHVADLVASPDLFNQAGVNVVRKPQQQCSNREQASEGTDGAVLGDVP